jgi:putative FmdB family regulatory protein
MPIYEFYCSECHTIYNFFSKSINTDKQPACPKCKKPKLERQVSLFAALDGNREDSGMEDGLPFDESKMENAMAALASEAENINEDDPRAAAQLMRKMSDMTGMKFNDSMEQAIARMEAGEDPEQIEKEMGDLLDGDEMPFVLGGKGGPKKRPPRRDETLYDL